ncbi:MAG: methyl-accepting chemotaxis protein [Clostridia bacterium]|jgi:methyl-accepting chemotaxis protein|nr:methyl-accepting chemotaxis protein [Clostridia bacterium]
MKKGVFVKIVAIIVMLAVIINAIYLFFLKGLITDVIMTEKGEKLAAGIKTANEMADLYYEGDWSIKNGAIHKGEFFIGNGNKEVAVNDLTDLIAEKTDTIVTIFMYDEKATIDSNLAKFVRASTNVKLKNGERAIGTYVSKKVGDIILSKKAYSGTANVVGVDYLTEYEPILDKDKNVIGILFAGTKIDTIASVVKNVYIEIMKISILTIAIAIGIAYAFAAMIRKNLNVLKDGIRKVAEGDLTSKVAINSNDEFGETSDYFNNMVDKLSLLVNNISSFSNDIEKDAKELKGMTAQTAESINQISSTIEDIAEGATNQVEVVNDTASNFTELEKNSNKIEEKANDMNESSNEIKDMSVKGLGVITELNDAKEENLKSIEQIKKVVEGLASRVNEIEEFTQAISQIAEQTNLLSLNASIEAARAGEHGRGFAVVAEEIRKLAEESGNSSDKIKKTIENILVEMVSVKKSVEIAKSVSEKQEKSVESTENIFKMLDESINKSITDIRDIYDKVVEFKVIKDKVTENIAKISDVTEQTAASTEEVAATIEEQNAYIDRINDSADKLKDKVKDLNDKAEEFKVK